MYPYRQSELCIDESSITEEDLVANVRCISAQFLHLEYLSYVRPVTRPSSHAYSRHSSSLLELGLLQVRNHDDELRLHQKAAHRGV